MNKLTDFAKGIISETSTSMLMFQIEVFALQKLQLKHFNSGIHAAKKGIKHE